MKKTNALRNILLVSIAAVLFLPLDVFLFLHPSFTKMLIDSAEKEAIYIGTHLSSMLPKDEVAIKRAYMSDAFHNQIKEELQNFHIMKIKTFSSSGDVVFSTDHKEIGELNKRNYFQEIVAKGNNHAKLTKKNTKTLEDKVVTVDVIETYIPIMSNGKFIGAFEIYYDITERKKELDKLIIRSSLVVFAVVFALLIAIILVSSNAKRANVERKKAVDALIRAGKLESVGRLAFGIAHEINNPLTNIALGVQILKNRCSDTEILHELESIEKNIKKASMIAKELLQSRNEGPEFVNVNVNHILISTLVLMEYKLQSVEVHQKLQEVPYVIGDPVKLEQVFVNVMDNAIDAMPNGGDIYISSSHEYGTVSIEISDNGTGIADGDNQKLFDQFFTTKKVGEGSGLGLSICYGIIKQHNGIIEVSSIEEKGTTVTIKLPVQEGHE